MSRQHDGRRQVKSKKSQRYPKPGRAFNYLEGSDKEWAKANRFDVAEYCVNVKDGKRFSGSNDTKLKCGDGRSGFSTRRAGQDDVSMEVGLDGQYKKRRSTLVNPKSARCIASRKARRIDGSICHLVNSVQIAEAMRDPIVVSEKKNIDKKFKRAENRNNNARRGYEKSLKTQVA